MSNDLKFAWLNIASRPVQSIITILVISLTVALTMTVIHLSDGLRKGIIQASDPFGVLVVGAKGSGQQLVLSTLLLQGNPVGNIPYQIYEELTEDERVRLAIPMAMGDNVGGARIIGTNRDFFELRIEENLPPAFQLASGELFDANFEAILGSQAAATLGLVIGGKFLASHGVTFGLARDVHNTPHTVVGILKTSNTTFDNVVFTSVDTVLELHGGHGAAALQNDGDKQITAILVKPTGFIEQNLLWQEFYTGTEAQAVFPGRELGGLFDLLNQGQQLLQAVGILTAVMAALTLFLAIYSVMGAREHLLAIFRSLGASRSRIFRLVLFETILVALLGTILGRLLGYAIAFAIATYISQQSAIPVTIHYLPELEWLFWFFPLLLGGIAGLIPALQAYRMNVVDKLFPT